MSWEKIIEWGESGAAQLWSFIVVALIVYALGLWSKTVAAKLKWKGTEENPSWFDIWLRAAPFLVGGFLGIIPWPCLHAIENIGEGSFSVPEAAARIGWFILAGAYCGQVYELVTFFFFAAKQKLIAKRESEAP